MSKPSYEELEAQVKQLAAERDAVVAENAALKEVIMDITFMDDESFFGSTQKAQMVMGRLVNIKTPATDAIISSLRAEGVEMFAKYIALYNSNAERHALSFAAQLRSQSEQVKGVQS